MRRIFRFDIKFLFQIYVVNKVSLKFGRAGFYSFSGNFVALKRFLLFLSDVK